MRRDPGVLVYCWSQTNWSVEGHKSHVGRGSAVSEVALFSLLQRLDNYSMGKQMREQDSSSLARSALLGKSEFKYGSFSAA